MSDLSWLNPTPHAIAVYASRPPSPVATQHSLPSGRYSLLGPDFHRLDRTSFTWRTHSHHLNLAPIAATRSRPIRWRKLRFPRLSIIADGFERHRTAIKRGLNPPH